MTQAATGERRFVPVRLKGDEAHPQRNLIFGVVAEDWRYKFLDDVEAKPGDEGLMLVEGEPPFEAPDGYVLVKVGEGPGALGEEGDEPVDYWCPLDTYFVEVIG